MTQILKILNNDAFIAGTGFIMGFCYHVRFDKHTLKYPLTSMFNGSVYGFWTSIGAEIVSLVIPLPMKCVIPITTTASSIYSLFAKRHSY